MHACEVETDELNTLKEQALLEGIIGTLTRIKRLLDHEKDPATAVEKLKTIIDGDGKHAVGIFASNCNLKVANILD